MTWIIGRGGPFGHAVGISDIRITLPDRSTHDCLRKLYKLGPQLVLGFAGSVQIGLEMVSQLAAILGADDDRRIWDPRGVADRLPVGAKAFFHTFPPKLRAKGCQLILLSAHPKESDGLHTRCFVHRFTAPDFHPIEARAGEIVSIGSGATIGPYADALSKLGSDMEMFKLELGFPGGSGLALMMSISSLLKRNPSRGISQRLQVCLVGRDSIRLGSNTREEPDADEQDRMPPLATSMEELNQLLTGYSAADIALATC